MIRTRLQGMQKKHWLAVGAILVVAAVIVSWQWGSSAGEADKAAAAETENTVQLTPGEVLTIAPRLLQQTVRVTGATAPRNQSAVASEVAGRVESVAFRAGDFVNKGDVLVQLDVETLGIQLRQQRSTAEATRAQLALAETQLERTASLVERGLAPSSSLEEMQASVGQLRASLAALQAQVAGAELSLEQATVTAPISGFVANRSVEPGQFVSVGTALMTLVDLSVLEVQAFAPVSAGAQVRSGQQVKLTVEGVRGKTFEGVVDRISPVTAEGTRSIPVFVTLDNSEGLLRGGMFAVGQIVVEQAEALALPAAALREDAEGTFVLVVEDEHLRRQPVDAGREWDGGRIVEIASGLSPGQVVVSAALPQLRPGDRIVMVMQ